MTTSPLMDPRVSLATALASQPGVYAMLLGSGVSTGAGVPTGWGVVENLVRRVAAASLAPLELDEDWEAWWHNNADGRELGYSKLLAELASTAPARRALLAHFFEPTDEELAEGIKAPGAAHHAIANLIAKGTVRVIITTNFDRLLEHALASLSINPQVIKTNSDIAGMEPLQHAPVTIIKVNGDYGSLDQRNTVDELSAYEPETVDLLKRVFDEYGLIVSGWSAEWDTALRATLKASANRRYPLYWTAWGHSLSAEASEVLARSGTHSITDVTADDFFPDLLARVEAVEQLVESPASHDIKLARLRRVLADPTRHLEVRRLLEEELITLRDWARRRPKAPLDRSPDALRAELTAIEDRFATLIDLFWNGILLDRDKQHTKLWIWTLQRAMNAREQGPASPFEHWWAGLEHYPAFLMVRAGILAALAADNERLIRPLLEEPIWKDIMRPASGQLPAYEVLHLYSGALDHQLVGELFPTRRSPSHFVRERLRPIAESIAGSSSAADWLLDRMEYRLALASALLGPSVGEYVEPAAGGEYLRGARRALREEFKEFPVTTDFLKAKGPAAWAHTPAEMEVFGSGVPKLDDSLWEIADKSLGG